MKEIIEKMLADETFNTALSQQFLAAGDTQYINKEEPNPSYYVSKLWLWNFYKLAQWKQEINLSTSPNMEE